MVGGGPESAVLMLKGEKVDVFGGVTSRTRSEVIQTSSKTCVGV